MTAEALERALRERPDDTAAWLAYGDRLREQGDARGRIIPLEVRGAHLPAAERDAVQRKVTALTRRHRRTWDAALPTGVTVLARRYGFPTKVAVQWSDGAPALIGRALREPFVTALRIRPASGQDDEYREDETDEPSDTVDTGALATLDLARLTGLDLSYVRIGAAGAKAVAVSAYLHAGAADVRTAGAGGRLETLDLRYCRIGDDGLAALADSPAFQGVRRIRLQKNLIGAKGVLALHRFAHLTELDLRYNEIGAEGARALLAAPFAGSLTRLLLHRDDVGDDGAAALARAPQLPPALRILWRNA
ncbi:TIGR02996 domain-containing protein [Actinomadura verrucosospora]|uniref:GALA protein 3 n=1 Tax=Actinomadura verrucosospora TaxID=46165 RepID=A0A7D3VXM5_ACTVE|nr:TIGR02996 domain-containing protein [Actinomadura verrucosospora]QKG21596.1 GALA protein 3 [Actinomadura verrucosospora]